MFRLENFKDLFKHNKELLTDDYNAKQAAVVKIKSSSEDKLFVRTIQMIREHFELILRLQDVSTTLQ